MTRSANGSLISKMLVAGTHETSSFQFAFELTVEGRAYLFYLNDRDEFQNWV